MEDITELFAELQEACRDTTPDVERILTATDGLAKAIAAGGIIPESIFDGITADARKAILLSYAKQLHDSVQLRFANIEQ